MIRAGILGAGGMGSSHAGRLESLGAEIAAVCDVSPKALENFQKKFPYAHIYQDFDQMLAETPIDVLLICVPPFAQDGQFEKAAAKKIPVFVEKPIALSTETGKKMVQAAKENGIATRVGFHMREGAAVRKIRDLVQSGEAGRPVLFSAQYECSSLHTPWWIQREKCGGQIFEQAIHLYDLCRYLCGDPQNVSGIMKNLCHAGIPGYTVEDVSVSAAELYNGALASITANNCAVPGRWEAKCTIVYENLTAFLTDPDHATLIYTHKNGLPEEHVCGTSDDLYRDEFQDFLDAVKTGRKSNCTILEGYKSLCYVAAAVKSAANGGVRTVVEE